MERYYEFDNELELRSRLKYWSDDWGKLNRHGECDIEDIAELPKELQRAYNELFKVGNGCYRYLAEYDGKYYIALVNEFDSTFANDINWSMDEVYEGVKKNALKLNNEDLFRNTVLVIGKETGYKECHEFIFLVPAMESKNVYDEIEKAIHLNIW